MQITEKQVEKICDERCKYLHHVSQWVKEKQYSVHQGEIIMQALCSECPLTEVMNERKRKKLRQL